MHGDELIGLVAVVLLFGGGTLFLLSVSPVGKAIAARIRGKAALGPEDGEMKQSFDAMRNELDDLRHLRGEVAELAERMDFAERLLAQKSDAGSLKPGS